MNIDLAEQVAWRFISSGFYSALSTVSVITFYTGVTTWEEFKTASGALALSALIGFITGILMAAHKYFFVGTTEQVVE